MDSQSTEVPAVKTKGSRRTWKKMEEDALILCMRNEYSDKWSADNGFKSGFFNLIEKELPKWLPNSKIQANPHIESKVKYWKTQYNQITDILQVSGFGWNDVSKCIVVDEESVWEDYVKAHNKAKGFNGKSFPYYDDWLILFGKDRATGEFAEDPTQMAEPDTPINLADCYIPQFDVEYASFEGQNLTPPSSTTPISNPRSSTPPVVTPPLPTAPGNAGSNKKGKKRTRMGAEESSIQESLENWMNISAGHMGDMVKSMGYPKELAALRKSIPAELGKLKLTTAQKFKLGAVISVAEERVDQFYGTPDEEKQDWVEAVLKGQVFPPYSPLE